MAPKSILRITSFKMAKPNRMVDDEASAYASVVSKLLPPFMRRKESKIAPTSAEKNPEEPLEERVDEADKRGVEDLLEIERTLEPSDERINMSVTFDSIIDTVSMVLTFDYDQKVATPTLQSAESGLENSLEVTYENYIEYENLKKELAEKAGDAGSEQATCDETLDGDQLGMEETAPIEEPIQERSNAIESVETAQSIEKERAIESVEINKSFVKEGAIESVEMDESIDKEEARKKNRLDELENELRELRQLKKEVEKDKLQKAAKAKLDEERRVIQLAEDVKQELELLRTLKIRVAEAKQKTKLKKAEAELNAIKAAIKKSKAARAPISETVQERLQASIKIVAEALAAQELLEVEVAEISARAAKEFKSQAPGGVRVSDPSKALLAPPPVTAKLQLPGGYKYRDDLSLDPNYSYSGDEPSSKAANDETSESEEMKVKDEKPAKETKSNIARKGLPGQNGSVADSMSAAETASVMESVTKAWAAVAELADDIKQSLVEPQDDDDDDDDGGDDEGQEEELCKEKEISKDEELTEEERNQKVETGRGERVRGILSYCEDEDEKEKADDLEEARESGLLNFFGFFLPKQQAK